MSSAGLGARGIARAAMKTSTDALESEKLRSTIERWLEPSGRDSSVVRTSKRDFRMPSALFDKWKKLKRGFGLHEHDDIAILDDATKLGKWQNAQYARSVKVEFG